MTVEVPRPSIITVETLYIYIYIYVYSCIIPILHLHKPHISQDSTNPYQL